MRAARLLDWKTTRTPRVVRSTIAGEAYAADDAIDRAYHTNCVMTEIISGEPVVKTGPKLLHVHATDCRSLFDAVISANPSTEEKRVLIPVRAIQEALDPKWFRWVPTGLMGRRRYHEGQRRPEMGLPPVAARTNVPPP